MRGLLYLLKETISEWRKDHVPRLAAALAFYASFSMAPLLIVVLGVAAIFLGESAARGELLAQIESLVGTEGARLIQMLIANSRNSGRSGLATVIGSLTLFVVALTAFVEMRFDLNAMWGVEPKPVSGIRGNLWDFMRIRILSFAMILVIGFLLLVSLAASAVLSYLHAFAPGIGFRTGSLIDILNLFISVSITALLFAAIFKYLPDALVGWRDVLTGALVTAILFNFGKYLIALYLARSAVRSTFGAAGSLAVLLLWVYYSAQVLFIGAEFTKVHAMMRGTGIQPSRYAVMASK